MSISAILAQPITSETVFNIAAVFTVQQVGFVGVTQAADEREFERIIEGMPITSLAHLLAAVGRRMWHHRFTNAQIMRFAGVVIEIFGRPGPAYAAGTYEHCEALVKKDKTRQVPDFVQPL